jgi:hypothetical protein
MHNIDIHVRPSRQFIALILLALIMALGAIWALSLSIALRGLLLGLTACYGVYILRRYGLLRTKDSLVAFRVLESGTWHLITNDKVYAGELAGDSTITGRLLVLRFAQNGAKLKRTFVIFKDALEASIYRRLLIQLRCR